MKKLILLIAIVAGTTLYAQDVQFGAKVGLNVAGYHGEDATGGGPLFSFHIGPVAEIMLTDQFAVQPELLFSAQGSSIDRETSVGTAIAKTEGKSKANYLQIPIMAKYYVMDGLALELGPQIGFLLSRVSDYTTTVYAGDAEYSSEDTSEKSKDGYNGFDAGINVGASYKLPYGLNLGARFNYGLTNYPEDTDLHDADLKNQVIQVSLGYDF